MRRIELYIREKLADLGDDARVLYTFAIAERTNPGIVKNSFSQQITLPGTPGNDVIFESFFRLDADARIQALPSGNPFRRVSFALFADGGVLLESGYARLDAVEREGDKHSYKVTLFGTLGDLLYSLDTSGTGVKRTLADLNYRTSSQWPGELDFNITANFVRNAWTRLLSGHGGTTELEDIVNFAACYEGVPDGFDAKHALVKAEDAGLQTSVEEEGVTYETRDGFALVDLGKESTGLQCRDFRSYLQRPVLSVYALFRAIGNAVDLELDPAFFKASNPFYRHAWLTLPALNTIRVGDGQTVVYGPVSFAVDGEAGSWLGSYGFRGMPNETAKAKGSLALTYRPRYVVDAQDAGTALYLDSGAVRPDVVIRGIMIQVVAYDASNVVVGASKVVSVQSDGQIPGHVGTTEDLATLTGYTPQAALADPWGAAFYGHFETVYNNEKARMEASWVGPDVTVGGDFSQVSYFIVYVRHVWKTYEETATQAMRLNYSRTSTTNTAAIDKLVIGGDMTYTYTEQATVRSGAKITKQLLLGGTMSPAEFLLSYCKRFGLVMSVEPGKRVLRIMARSTWYGIEDGYAADISGRICRDRKISQTPTAANKRWLRWAEAEVEAAWLKEYAAGHGTPYGQKLVSTGYDFDTSEEGVLTGSRLKSAPEVMERDLTFVDVTSPARPAVFLRGGLKYGLWSEGGDLKELDLPGIPSTATITYWNDTYNGYDRVSRLQLHDAGGKAVDGSGVLLFFQGGGSTTPDADLTDDRPEMFVGGREDPCWILNPHGLRPGQAPLRVPLFGRHLYTDGARAELAYTMDFSVPLELDLPGVLAPADIGVYDLFWRAFVADRYSLRTKSVTLYMNTRGMDVSARSLRRFYWMDGAIFVLTKIGPHDLEGDGVTKAEFVQVQDIDAYFDYPEL